MSGLDFTMGLLIGMMVVMIYLIYWMKRSNKVLSKSNQLIREVFDYFGVDENHPRGNIKLSHSLQKANKPSKSKEERNTKVS